MENQENSKQDCGCSDGCCTPKKKSTLWTKILFIVIILAAGTIITVKLTGKTGTPANAKCCETSQTQSSSCCPETAKQDSVPAKCCDTQEEKPCCPQSESEK